MTLYRRVQVAAAGADLRVVVTTAAIAPLYAVGWLAGRIARTIWRGLVWLYTAAHLGIVDGWGSQ